MQKRLMVVENEKAKVSFKMENISIGQINDMYNALCKSGLGWETKEFTYDYEDSTE